MGESETRAPVAAVGAYELIKQGMGISAFVDLLNELLETHPVLRCAPSWLEAMRPVETLFLIQVLGGPIASADADLTERLRSHSVTNEKWTACIGCLEQALQTAGAGDATIGEVVQRAEVCRHRLVNVADR